MAECCGARRGAGGRLTGSRGKVRTAGKGAGMLQEAAGTGAIRGRCTPGREGLGPRMRRVSRPAGSLGSPPRGRDARAGWEPD